MHQVVSILFYIFFYSEKVGSCPIAPTGPWICTGRCSRDSDCKRTYKCCKNRCGALACMAPEIDN